MRRRVDVSWQLGTSVLFCFCTGLSMQGLEVGAVQGVVVVLLLHDFLYLRARHVARFPFSSFQEW